MEKGRARDERVTVFAGRMMRIPTRPRSRDRVCVSQPGDRHCVGSTQRILVGAGSQRALNRGMER